jgi:membrane-associated phospholipid phosphatase
VTRHFWWGVALAIAAVLLGFAIAPLQGIDKATLAALAMTRAHSADSAIAVTQFVTRLGDPSVRGLIVIAVLAVLGYRRQWRTATVFLVTVAVSITGHSVMKEAFARARPNLVPGLDQVDTFSFPSGHAAGAAVVLLLGALMLGGKRLQCVALLVVFAIGLSRVALGVHWPSDVVGGWIFGGGMALIGYAVAKRVAHPKESPS